VKFGPNRKGDVPHSLASVDKAIQFLNYSPLSTIDQGIKCAIDWYYNNI
jgi:UDP-N-acetylglucosamine 4-epimerase